MTKQADKAVDNHMDGGGCDSHHFSGGKVAMTALIEFVCREHTEPRGAGPLITPVDGGWGYCEGYGSGGHKWTRIEPTSREHIADASPIRELRAS